MGLDQTVYAHNKPELSREEFNECWDELPNWYWRKANSIHAWMVKNVQNGEDDCGCYRLTIPKIVKLENSVKRVLANPALAHKVLPTQQGFFFGGTEYDEWYFEYLKTTAKYLSEMLKLHKLYPDTCFFYTSSW